MSPRPTDDGRRRATALAAAAVAVGMVGLSFASVPLYRLFCQVTGYGGTTQRAEAGAGRIGDRTVTVRFDANVAAGIGWKFVAPAPVKLRLGETGEVHFRAMNLGTRPSTGQAIFNVAPDRAGVYFNKIECFCFTDQTLAPGQAVDMAVTFFVDPDLAEDRANDFLDTITLSYTFYPNDKAKPVAAAERATGALN